jgi:hypothetical protein
MTHYEFKGIRSLDQTGSRYPIVEEVRILSPTGDSQSFRFAVGQPGEWNAGMRTLFLVNSTPQGRAFGQVRQDGSIRVFGKWDYMGSIYRTYARMLEYPEIFRSKGAVYSTTLRCRRCHRILISPSRIDPGLGPDCAKAVYGEEAVLAEENVQETSELIAEAQAHLNRLNAELNFWRGNPGGPTESEMIRSIARLSRIHLNG